MFTDIFWEADCKNYHRKYGTFSVPWGHAFMPKLPFHGRSCFHLTNAALLYGYYSSKNDILVAQKVCSIAFLIQWFFSYEKFTPRYQNFRYLCKTNLFLTLFIIPVIERTRFHVSSIAITEVSLFGYVIYYWLVLQINNMNK